VPAAKVAGCAMLTYCLIFCIDCDDGYQQHEDIIMQCRHAANTPIFTHRKSSSPLYKFILVNDILWFQSECGCS
jgi:hypothetical protein